MKKITSLLMLLFLLVFVTNAFASSINFLPIDPGPFLQTSQLKEEKPEEEKIKEVKELLKKEPERPMPSDIRRGGLLLKKGEIGFDLSFAYAHLSENKIFIEGFALLPVLVIGEITVEEIKQDIFIGSITPRYGITDRIQLEVTVPYRLHYESYFRPGVTIGKQEESNTDYGLGDIQANLLLHLLHETATLPHILLGITFKTRTGKSVFEIDPQKGEIPLGTGYYAVRSILSFIKTADPAVVFLNIGYTYPFAREDNIWLAQQDPDTKEIYFVKQVIRLEPGKTFEGGFGVAYALSYKLALNMQYQQSITLSSERNSVRIPGSSINSGYLRLGGIWAWSDKTYLDLSTSIGVTTDAPDTVVELRISKRF